MKTTSYVSLIATALLISGVGYASSDYGKAKSKKSKIAKVGEMAPDFKLPSTAGKSLSLSDYKGKNVVLEWLNHDCPYVKTPYGSGNMQALQKEAATRYASGKQMAAAMKRCQEHIREMEAA